MRDFEDNFHGTDDALLASSMALLEMDSADVLVPHGIGGHAREIIGALACRLDAAKKQLEEVMQIAREAIDLLEGK